jgi:hypothetical protein
MMRVVLFDDTVIISPLVDCKISKYNFGSCDFIRNGVIWSVPLSFNWQEYLARSHQMIIDNLK